jgi:hypothetical protein
MSKESHHPGLLLLNKDQIQGAVSFTLNFKCTGSCFFSLPSVVRASDVGLLPSRLPAQKMLLYLVVLLI